MMYLSAFAGPLEFTLSLQSGPVGRHAGIGLTFEDRATRHFQNDARRSHGMRATHVALVSEREPGATVRAATIQETRLHGAIASGWTAAC